MRRHQHKRHKAEIVERAPEVMRQMSGSQEVPSTSAMLHSATTPRPAASGRYGSSSGTTRFIPICVLTSKPEMREVGHGTQPLWIGLKLLEPVTDPVNHTIERWKR
jgi:hypothetical protein